MKVGTPHPFNYNFRAAGSGFAGPLTYAIDLSTRGLVLVARSQQGVCAIFIDDDAGRLRAELAKAFPHADLHEDQDAVRADLNRVISFLDGGGTDSTIELDIAGTPFQQSVWRALCAIPAGQTRSYTQIAQQLESPKAVRAVAGACAANVLAVAIPCHRAVRADGSLSGYRWGVERKRQLLQHEGRA